MTDVRWAVMEKRWQGNTDVLGKIYIPMVGCLVHHNSHELSLRLNPAFCDVKRATSRYSHNTAKGCGSCTILWPVFVVSIDTINRSL